MYAAIGQVFLINGEDVEANRMLQQAIDLYSAIGSRYSIPAQIGNYGWTLRRIGKPDQAKPYLLQAAELFAGMGLDDYAQRHRRAAQGADPQVSLLQQWQPVIALVVATIQGDEVARSQLLPLLDQLSSSGDWRSLAAALQRVLAGERDRDVLLPGLDATDQSILAATLDALQPEASPEMSPAQVRTMLEQLAAERRQAADLAGLVEVLDALVETNTTLADWPAVVAVAEERLALDQGPPDLWAALADARSNLSDETGAAAAYTQAVLLAPDEPMLRRNYANSLINLNQLDEAAVQLNEAERLDPDAPYLALRRAELARAHADRGAAKQWAQEALRRQPGWEAAVDLLTWAQSPDNEQAVAPPQE